MQVIGHNIETSCNVYRDNAETVDSLDNSSVCDWRTCSLEEFICGCSALQALSCILVMRTTNAFGYDIHKQERAENGGGTD